MSLSHDDVTRLLQLLDASQFDALELEADGVKLSLRRRGAGAVPGASTTAATEGSIGASALASRGAAANTPVQPAARAPATAGLIDIRAPMLGTFYGAPKPGAAPFVAVGSEVGPDSVVGIVEVMKLMNSIPAATSGEVVEILVGDGALVEYGQVLMRVLPA
jgi:acetyl-CoA carboxylase biotin carboxyl carrier protein